ncbi:hypothetical protein [Nocardiopsis quinghaiensis]|uniref:hypothetical protein n=1 Tax=Nocardiopsis quinghaiensis TaxID=464995 RepID=UPI001238B4C8|nr:hypothetical protein [Nocardiopsis quinghaiensis]
MSRELGTYSEHDAEEAAQLVGYGLRPRLRPHRDTDYADLIRRYNEEPAFEQLVRKSAAGLGLRVIGITQRAGAVFGTLPGSVFETKLDHYARQARQTHQREAERVLHGIAHLAIAACCFPRPEDLADDGYVGQATVSTVDNLVRHACRELSARVDESEENSDPMADAPELERAWRVYLRRPEANSTSDGRAAPPSTEAIVGKALRYLVDQGMLTEAEDEELSVKVYRTTGRYQLQVRELAAVEAYDELLRLGVPAGPAATGVIRFSDSGMLY